MSDPEIRKIAKETGFIKKFKFTFTNSFDFKRSLWVGYVYQILASREGNKLSMRKVIPSRSKFMYQSTQEFKATLECRS
jgi:hypothetical protein